MQLSWYFWLMSLIWQDTFGPAGPVLKVIWMHFSLHFPVKDCFCSLKFLEETSEWLTATLRPKKEKRKFLKWLNMLKGFFP